MPSLPTVGASTDTWGTELNAFLNVAHRAGGELKTSPVVYNVKDYGAVGNGSTDDTAAIQAAIDALPQANPVWGGVVYFPTGTYKCNSTLNIGGVFGLVMRGDGGTSSVEGTTIGSALVTGSSTMTLLDMYGEGSGALHHYGPVIEGLNFKDVATPGTSTLLRLYNVNRYQIRGCAFRNAAEGLRLVRVSPGGDNAWGSIEQCRWLGNTLGMGCYGVNNLNVYAGDFNDNRTGVYHDNKSSAINYFGTKMDTYVAGDIGWHCLGFWNSWFGCAWEGFQGDNTIGWKWDSDFTGSPGSGAERTLFACSMYGGDIAGAIGVQIVDTDSQANALVFARASSFSGGGGSVPLSDGGYRTQVLGTGYYAVGGLTTRLTEVIVGTASTHPRLISGDNTPESAVAAPVGSFYMDKANGVAYMKKTGTGITGWKLITQAA